MNRAIVVRGSLIDPSRLIIENGDHERRKRATLHGRCYREQCFLRAGDTRFETFDAGSESDFTRAEESR
jgi:hypothetical protein